MKHLKNRRSGKYLCEVFVPHLTDNVTMTGAKLGVHEPDCKVCSRYFSAYRKKTREHLTTSRIGRGLLNAV